MGLSGEAAQPQLFTPSQLVAGAPTFLVPGHFAFPNVPNADVIPGWGKNQLLWVSWPALLGISTPPFSHPSGIYSISLLVSLPSCWRSLLGEVFFPLKSAIPELGLPADELWHL